MSEVTSGVHSGTKAVLSSSRANTWYGPKHDILSVFLSNGQGDYNVSGWAKLASGSDTVKVTLKLVDSSGTRYLSNTATVGTSWAQMSGIQNVTWTGTLSSATLYVQTNSSLANMYVDDCSLKKQ